MSGNPSLLLLGMLLVTSMSSPLEAQRDARRGSAGGDPTSVGEAVDSPAEEVWRTRAGEVDQRSMDRPSFVSGKVLMDDGSSLPGPVTVNLVCQGSVRQQAATFGDGDFSLELDFDLKSMDASVSGNEPSPKEGQKELRKPKGNISKAIKELKKAVKAFPEFAAAWYLLGTSRLALKKESEARDSFDRAIEADPNYVNPFLALAGLEMQTENWPEVTRLCETVIALNPHIVEAQYLNAVAGLNLKKLDSAQASIEKVQAAGPSQFLAGSHYILGAVLAEKHQYDSAAREFQLFLQTSPGEPIESQLKQTLMEWEELGLIKSAGVSESASN